MHLTFQCSRRQIKIDFSALTNKEIAAQICIHRARNSQSIAESNIEKAKDERQKKLLIKIKTRTKNGRRNDDPNKPLQRCKYTTHKTFKHTILIKATVTTV